MTIREAGIDDVEQLVCLIRGTLPRDVKGFTLYDCSGVARYVRQNVRASKWGGDNRYFVAVMGAEVVGAIEVQLTTVEIFIKYVAVAPIHRRKGLANALLGYVLATCVEKPTLSLHVLESNTAALTWYESLGMQNVSTVGWYAGDVPRAQPGSFTLVSGYPQMSAQFDEFGFATITLKAASRTSNIGVLGEKWLRFTSWDDVRQPEFAASLQRIWPHRRALVIEAAACPAGLENAFAAVAQARLMQGAVSDIARNIAGGHS